MTDEHAAPRRSWFGRLFEGSPVNGAAGRARGYAAVLAKVDRGMADREATQCWVNADPPRDDYDRGVLEALADSGFKDPLEQY